MAQVHLLDCGGCAHRVRNLLIFYIMKPTVIAVGNITKDIPLEYTKNSRTPVCKFTVACNGTNEETTFLWCVAYGKAAENIQKFFGKGSPIQVVGELSQYSDEKKQTHSYCDVRQWGFVNGGSKKENPPPTRERYAENDSSDAGEDGGDNPF